MSIIDNDAQTMHEALINALTSVDRVDIEVAFFYFSGWELIAKHLKDKKVRILVGKYIDPDAIPELLSRIKQEDGDVDLGPFQPRKALSSRSSKKQTYIDGFLRLSNETALLDESEDQDAYKILENKIADGTLEIKLTATQEHGKMYILHNKFEFSHNGDYPGTVFMGSSNFTFQGLLNQGELNERHNDKAHYDDYVKKFEALWKESKNIDIATAGNTEDFLSQIKKNLWIYSSPSPYALYVRVLHELFGKENEKSLKTPGQITRDKYLDLEYQVDAVKSVLDKLEKYDGVILADVVGLGKSIIASAAAHNYSGNTVIIAPPHLKDQWDDYQEDFKLPGARVFSSGLVKDVYERYKESDKPLLLIIDEAHRFRNEDTDDYTMLHHICNSHPENKVMLLTATPFNNAPKDVFSLVKLFQVPGQSTIRSVDNLSLRFRDLIDRFKKLNQARRTGKIDQTQMDKEADEISLELRRLIENVVIRRSRIDLETITRYKEDLIRQNIAFAKVEGPELLKYNLGDILDLYLNTLLEIIADKEEGGFIGARYKPTTYIKDTKAFLELYGEDLDESDLKTAQTNLAKMMKRLLVMRFESSKDAFRATLNNMIASTLTIEKWWDTLGKVPILKKGQVPDPDEILDTTDDEIDREVNAQTIEKELQELKEKKGIISIDNSLIDPEFIEHVKKDRMLLEKILNNWFGPDAEPHRDFDPKLDRVKKKIDELLKERHDRKIVIFSSYADTVHYLCEQLDKRGLKRVLKYTGSGSSKEMKRTVKKNFDAGLKESDQENEYDILVTTDALSEGYNLHRAGVVINYDIPYNPTRVIQRVGRINRINKKVFEKLFIYNCFPTDVGESEIRIKQISTLKMRLIGSVMGIDSKTLTDDEKLQSFLKDEYQRAEEASEVRSWDAPHKEAYDQARKDKELFNEALTIKQRSRVVREGQKTPAIVAFGKKGSQSIFALKETQEPGIVAAETALNYFRADKEEKGKEPDKHYDEVFKLVRDELFKKHPLPSIRGRRADALNNIKFIEQQLPAAKDYCHDLADIIKKYDGINEGDLKSMAQLSVKDTEAAFEELKNIIPEHQIRVIIERVARVEGEYETIVFSEDIRE
ncbi:MAG: helicase-related protein [Candidatus Aceula meridiana]|nr:helicase-related protein [Candidatus Aceula meridiana]